MYSINRAVGNELAKAAYQCYKTPKGLLEVAARHPKDAIVAPSKAFMDIYNYGFRGGVLGGILLGIFGAVTIYNIAKIYEDNR